MKNETTLSAISISISMYIADFSQWAKRSEKQFKVCSWAWKPSSPQWQLPIPISIPVIGNSWGRKAWGDWRGGGAINGGQKKHLQIECKLTFVTRTCPWPMHCIKFHAAEHSKFSFHSLSWPNIFNLARTLREDKGNPIKIPESVIDFAPFLRRVNDADGQAVHLPVGFVLRRRYGTCKFHSIQLSSNICTDFHEIVHSGTQVLSLAGHC